MKILFISILLSISFNSYCQEPYRSYSTDTKVPATVVRENGSFSMDTSNNMLSTNFLHIGDLLDSSINVVRFECPFAFDSGCNLNDITKDRLIIVGDTMQLILDLWRMIDSKIKNIVLLEQVLYNLDKPLLLQQAVKDYHAYLRERGITIYELSK